ncbi:8-amino-7-oxononanoate synthase [Cobetia sp. 14N.309.X.WAT.E.A4]|uniref:aminotransferase class I/II-fold pyridoxal phosphate-dependent enzyme n=1 Tax=Cobetia sp. 14N.309.X.WAT.E.A4 TaxID=2998323 RepID=UPI0025AF5989|nr:8-amino-7-oxononanoate synthase [Cobetia sp. 14N.309.X.WAT.E.A4]MDN2654974.1 8-amino-7-oxononanoate synthase [Cobetia sp. 14N.309.X.WAT.E.A4]
MPTRSRTRSSAGASFAHLDDLLARREQVGRYRRRLTLDSPQGPHVSLAGQAAGEEARPLLNFTANDYLGLANHPALVEAGCRAAHEFGVGSGSAHLVNGHQTLHHRLEARLAELTGRPRALLFSTGFMANLGVIDALASASREAGRTLEIFHDRLNHASLLDGARLASSGNSAVRSRRFHHRDLEDLERQLARSQADDRLVISDGVFSMDGDCADITGLARACARHGAWLMIDDAHGVGVLGEHGEGLVGRDTPLAEVPVLVGTLGKALGSAGAFVAGSEALIESLIQLARPYIYTTAQPPHVAAATLAALDIVEQEPQRREHLAARVRQFREGCAALLAGSGLALGLPLVTAGAPSPLTDPMTPIQPLVLGSETRALAWSAALRERGILVSAIRPPTVPAGSSRLRFTFSAAHSENDVETLLAALREVLESSTTRPTTGAET